MALYSIMGWCEILMVAVASMSIVMPHSEPDPGC